MCVRLYTRRVFYAPLLSPYENYGGKGWNTMVGFGPFCLNTPWRPWDSLLQKPIISCVRVMARSTQLQRISTPDAQ